jgi:hypothetical protein
MAIDESGWTLVWRRCSSPPTHTFCNDRISSAYQTRRRCHRPRRGGRRSGEADLCRLCCRVHKGPPPQSPTDCPQHLRSRRGLLVQNVCRLDDLGVSDAPVGPCGPPMDVLESLTALFRRHGAGSPSRPVDDMSRSSAYHPASIRPIRQSVSGRRGSCAHVCVQKAPRD